MKHLPIAVLKGCSYVGTSLYRLGVLNAFGGRARFDSEVSHIIPQGVLSPWQGVGLELEWLELELDVMQDFPSTQ